VSIAASVVLPVYSPGLPLKMAIESILNQNFSSFEFIIIDDASKDDSAKIIADYARQDSRIVPIFHSKNAGLTYSLNEGLALAKAPIVIRIDHDDQALEHRIKTQLDFLANNPEITIVGSYVYHMGAKPRYDKLITLPTTHQDIAQTLTQYNCMYHPSVAFRKEEILKIGGYRNNFKNAEDYDLWLRASKHYKFANIDEPLLRYRFSVNGMTLGSKWQQVYFVHLAQAAYRDPGAKEDELRNSALMTLAELDRHSFMKEAYSGTINEMIELGFSIGAIQLALKGRKEIGLRESLKLQGRIIKSTFSSFSP
jgi:glycosyltransferase involved in cell wall biosynthesis